MDMSDYVTNQQLEDTLSKALTKQTDEILGVMQTFMHQVDERFNKVEKDIEDIKASLDRLTNTVHGFAKNIEDMRADNAARDAQFARLTQWAKEVSAKTGIPMPQL